MLDGDGVEWFETVDDSETGTAFLYDAKPSRSVGRIGRFVHTSIDFSANDFADFVVNARGNRDIALDPRC